MHCDELIENKQTNESKMVDEQREMLVINVILSVNGAI